MMRKIFHRKFKSTVVIDPMKMNVKQGTRLKSTRIASSFRATFRVNQEPSRPFSCRWRRRTSSTYLLRLSVKEITSGVFPSAFTASTSAPCFRSNWQTLMLVLRTAQWRAVFPCILSFRLTSAPMLIRSLAGSTAEIFVDHINGVMPKGKRRNNQSINQ